MGIVPIAALLSMAAAATGEVLLVGYCAISIMFPFTVTFMPPSSLSRLMTFASGSLRSAMKRIFVSRVSG